MDAMVFSTAARDVNRPYTRKLTSGRKDHASDTRRQSARDGLAASTSSTQARYSSSAAPAVDWKRRDHLAPANRKKRKTTLFSIRSTRPSSSEYAKRAYRRRRRRRAFSAINHAASRSAPESSGLVSFVLRMGCEVSNDSNAGVGPLVNRVCQRENRHVPRDQHERYEHTHENHDGRLDQR